MALSKLEPDAERVEEIARRMKEIIETTWLRDPNLNDESAAEFQALREELGNMGLHVTHQASMSLADPSNPRIEAEINIWIPKNTTIQ